MTQPVDRYLLALPRGEGKVFLAWRLLKDDTPDLGFHIQRKLPGDQWQIVSDEPVTDSTNFLDKTLEGRKYEYRVVAMDDTQEPSVPVTVDSGAEATIKVMDAPLTSPAAYTGDGVAGELLNDGRMGYVLRATRAGTIWLCAYSHAGKVLWEIDTRLPAHGGWDGGTGHCPFLSWDVNGDGRTEVAFHSCKGKFPSDRYEKGGSNEFLTVVDSETGDLVWETPWPAVEPRVMMTLGHLHGLDQPASLVILD